MSLYKFFLVLIVVFFAISCFCSSVSFADDHTGWYVVNETAYCYDGIYPPCTTVIHFTPTVSASFDVFIIDDYYSAEIVTVSGVIGVTQTIKLVTHTPLTNAWISIQNNDTTLLEPVSAFSIVYSTSISYGDSSSYFAYFNQNNYSNNGFTGYLSSSVDSSRSYAVYAGSSPAVVSGVSSGVGYSIDFNGMAFVQQVKPGENFSFYPSSIPCYVQMYSWDASLGSVSSSPSLIPVSDGSHDGRWSVSTNYVDLPGQTQQGQFSPPEYGLTPGQNQSVSLSPSSSYTPFISSQGRNYSASYPLSFDCVNQDGWFEWANSSSYPRVGSSFSYNVYYDLTTSSDLISLSDINIPLLPVSWDVYSGGSVRLAGGQCQYVDSSIYVYDGMIASPATGNIPVKDGNLTLLVTYSYTINWSAANISGINVQAGYCTLKTGTSSGSPSVTVTPWTYEELPSQPSNPQPSQPNPSQPSVSGSGGSIDLTPFIQYIGDLYSHFFDSNYIPYVAHVDGGYELNNGAGPLYMIWKQSAYNVLAMWQGMGNIYSKLSVMDANLINGFNTTNANLMVLDRDLQKFMPEVLAIERYSSQQTVILNSILDWLNAYQGANPDSGFLDQFAEDYVNKFDVEIQDTEDAIGKDDVHEVLGDIADGSLPDSAFGSADDAVLSNPWGLWSDDTNNSFNGDSDSWFSDSSWQERVSLW